MQDRAGEAGKSEALLPAGTLFGKYQIVRCVGVGGMGAVYEATHTLLKKPVALKTLHALLATHGEHRTRFLREGEAVARIRNPSVVDVSDVGVQDGIPYLVMELLQGENLHQMLRREGPLDERRIANIMIPVVDGLAAAHAAGVIHRDLKPENVFLARDGKGEIRPKLLDFGISKVAGIGGDLSVTSAGALLGTPYYMSPEQAEGAQAASWSSDQYAVGVMMYEAATGRLPFFQERLLDLMNAIANGVFLLPRVLRPELGHELENVIVRAMSTKPEARFESLEALGRALIPFASSRVRAQYGPHFGLPSEHDSVAPPSGEAALTPPPGSLATPRLPSGASGRFPATPSDAATVRPAMRSPTAAAAVPTPAPDMAHRISSRPTLAERPVSDAPPRPSSGTRRTGLVVGGLVVVLLAVGVFLAFGSGAAPATPPVTHPVVADAPPPAPTTFGVAIVTEPPGAGISLDGEPAGSGQLARVLPRDGREHTLLVTADGFVPRIVRFRDTPPPDRVVLATDPAHDVPVPPTAPVTPHVATPPDHGGHRHGHDTETGATPPAGPNDDIRLNR